jgi:hypothetical protein
MDSLMLLLGNPTKLKDMKMSFTSLAEHLSESSRFQSNDRPITQLKNSGSLRLIRNEEAADSMIILSKIGRVYIL